MSFKSIATFISSDAEASLVLPAASALTAQYDGHLSVCAIGIDMTSVSGFHIGVSPVVLGEALGRAQERASELETVAQRQLEGTAVRWSSEAAVAPYGGLTSLVGQRARFTDLVIQARPYGKTGYPEQVAVVEAALFEAGAPVLVVPGRGLPPEGLGRRIAVAWNQSGEALAAIRRALPLLKEADKVSVVIVDPPVHGAERSDPGGQLTQMLARHGVRAEVVVLAKTMPRVSDVLLRHVNDSASDLLVMGAYGHSRLREAILGGATRNILENSEWPVFLAH